MNALDKVIAYFSPEVALKRQMQRNALNVYERSYDAGRYDEPNSRWRPALTSSENAILPYRSRIIARARDLERNDPVAGAIIDGIATNVVGAGGYALRSVVVDANDERQKDIADRLEDLFKEWAEEPIHCDYGGEMTFAEILKLAERELVTVGEAFIRIVHYSYEPDGIPLMLQALESELLDTSVYQHGNNPVNGGIEFDANTGRRVAYHFFMGGVDGWNSVKSARIPAADICHLYDKRRGSQKRGMTKFSRTMPLLKDLDGYIESTAVKARVEACFCGFITKEDYGGTVDAPADNKAVEMSPGMLQRLRPGEKVEMATPATPGGGFSEFMSQSKLIVGAASGASYELVSRDVSRVNYSSARINMLEDQKHFKWDQALIISRICKPVYKTFVEAAALSGRLNGVLFYGEYLKDKKRYQAQKWLPTGWPWVDPQKEIAANKEALDAKLTTRTEILASRGKDMWEMMEEWKQEENVMKEMGISREFAAGGKSKQEDTLGEE